MRLQDYILVMESSVVLNILTIYMGKTMQGITTHGKDMVLTSSKEQTRALLRA